MRMVPCAQSALHSGLYGFISIATASNDAGCFMMLPIEKDSESFAPQKFCAAQILKMQRDSFSECSANYSLNVVNSLSPINSMFKYESLSLPYA